MDKEVQGKINERLQVILSTAQNCIHEIREDADAIELGWILIDLRRVVKKVESICEIMQAAVKEESDAATKDASADGISRAYYVR